jgi:ribosomal protein L32
MGKFSIFECPNCHSKSTAGEWNAATYREATAKHKKVRTKIQDAGNAPNLSYVCPNCGALSTKNTIRGRFASE